MASLNRICGGRGEKIELERLAIGQPLTLLQAFDEESGPDALF